MNNFKFSLLSLTRSVNFKINSSNELDEVYSHFLLLFDSNVNYENQKIEINTLQKNTNEFKLRVGEFVSKYSKVDVKFNQFNSYFKELKENEHFFILPTHSIPENQLFQLFNYLLAVEEDKDFINVNNEMNNLFGELRNQYDVIAFGENTKLRIGEPDKTKRICRFCQKSIPDTSYKKIAHSISEALGNKKIITNDECDSCNEKFGEGIENDLITYLNLYRNYFGVKGKNGIPVLKGKNFEIRNNNDGTIEIKHYLTKEEEENPNHDDFNFHMETNEKITVQNIYKALSKYALSVIPNEFLNNFQETIKWINGELSISELPKVGLLTSYELFSQHPQLIVYRRKSDNNSLPYLVGEFRFTFVIFVFIIPLSSKDSLSFTKESEFDTFWNFFKHYHSSTNWTFKKLNDTTPRIFKMNLKFNEKSK